MSAAEKHDSPLPFWPAAMTMEMALAYTQVSRSQLEQWKRSGVVRFRARGPNGAMITERVQLDLALHGLFAAAAEDMDFGDDGD